LHPSDDCRLSLLSLLIPPPPSSTLFPYTTLFRSLAHGKGVERSTLGVRRGGDGIGHGIGAERETADQVGGPATGGEALEPQGADEGEAFSRHRGVARIDVKAGAAPGGERKVAVRHRPLPQEVAEASLEVAGRSHEMLVVASATTILLGVGPRA